MIPIGDATLRFGRRGLEAIRVRVSLHSGTDVEGTRARIAADAKREILRATSAAVESRDSSAALASRSDSVRLVAAAEELVIAFPGITSASYTRNDNLLGHDSTASRPVMLVSFTHKTRTSAKRAVINRVHEYLRKRLNAPQLVVEER